MNTRFYNAKILVLDAENHFSIAEDELHVTGDTITYIGPGRKADPGNDRCECGRINRIRNRTKNKKTMVWCTAPKVGTKI